MLQSMNHHHHPHDPGLQRELAAYADDLKLIHVLNKSTDSAKFAQRIYTDVLA